MTPFERTMRPATHTSTHLERVEVDLPQLRQHARREPHPLGHDVGGLARAREGGDEERVKGLVLDLKVWGCDGERVLCCSARV
jgi:hypothetical protein